VHASRTAAARPRPQSDYAYKINRKSEAASHTHTNKHTAILHSRRINATHDTTMTAAVIKEDTMSKAMGGSGSETHENSGSEKSGNAEESQQAVRATNEGGQAATDESDKNKSESSVTHGRCYRWMTRHGLGCLARLPGKWPRMCALVFGVVSFRFLRIF